MTETIAAILAMGLGIQLGVAVQSIIGGSVSRAPISCRIHLDC